MPIFIRIAAVFLAASALADADLAVLHADLPDGLQIQIYADGLPKARQLAVRADGTVAVGSRSNQVYLLRDDDGDGVADWRRNLSGLSAPNGVAWQGDDLYIGETARILVARDVVAQLAAGARVGLDIVIDGLPSSGHHGARVLGFDNAGKLLVSLGVPCNICIPPHKELTGTIRRYDVTSGAGETVAYGFRNSVGFDWHPQTGELWATDHGRDWLGDDLPSDELNRVHSDGLHFGYPYCHQGDLSDPEYGGDHSCDEFEPPAFLTGPHVANNGIHFYRGSSEQFAGTAFIALHGSWNRSEKIGYRVDQIKFSADGTAVAESSVLVGGWHNDDDVLARPVDVDELPDGSLLISDDYTGSVFRVFGF